jgi:protein TonB
LACGLIRQAARRAPPDLAERLEEEWLADLTVQPSALACLCFALGCCRATCVIAREHAVTRIATSSTGGKTMTLDLPTSLPRRTGAFLAVIGLHFVMVYLLATGLATQVIQLLPTPTTVVLKEERPVREAPPPPPAPTLQKFQLELPQVMPDIRVDDTPKTTDAIVAASPCQGRAACAQPGVAPAVTSPPVVRVPGGIGKGFPNTEDYYPTSAIRLGQEGTAGVRVCIDGAGRLTSQPTLAESSGITSIDSAALRLARAGSGHYRPTTENGQPVSACYAVHIRFNLRN